MLDDPQFDDLMDLLEIVAQLPDEDIDWENIGGGNA